MNGKKINSIIAAHTLISACAGIVLALSLFISFQEIEQHQQKIANNALVLNDFLRLEDTYRQWLVMMDLVLGNDQTYLATGAKRQASFFFRFSGTSPKHPLG